MSTERQRELKRRRQRRAKIRKLRTSWQKASDSRREKLIDKVWKINPAVLSELTSK